jgi:hypothetical protein
MAQENFGDDLISVVNRIMDDRLKYLYRYIGDVKSIDKDGIVQVYIPEIGMPDSPDSWVTALAGNRVYSAIPVQVNDKVEIYFPDGTLTSARYNCLEPSYDSPNGGLKKYVIFELSKNVFLMYDDNSKEYIIKNSLGEITLSGTKFEVDILGIKTTIDSSGISTTGGVSDGVGTMADIRQDIELFKQSYNAHSHGVVSLPVSTTTPTNNPI